MELLYYSLLYSRVNFFVSIPMTWEEKEINGQGGYRYEYLFIFGFYLCPSKGSLGDRLIFFYMKIN